MRCSMRAPCRVILGFLAAISAAPSSWVAAGEEYSPSRRDYPAKTEHVVRHVGGLPVPVCLDGRREEDDTGRHSSIVIVPLAAIRLYQTFISPSLGRRCRFRPSCSEFACQALTARGLFTGIAMTADRLARDHGFIRSGDYPQDEIGTYLDPVESPCMQRREPLSQRRRIENESRGDEHNRPSSHE